MNLREYNIEAHFTRAGYLSINRSFINTYIKNLKNGLYDDYDEVFITVDGIEFDMSKIVKNITYNEHKNIVRLDNCDWKYCISNYNKKE